MRTKKTIVLISACLLLSVFSLTGYNLQRVKAVQSDYTLENMISDFKLDGTEITTFGGKSNLRITQKENLKVGGDDILTNTNQVTSVTYKNPIHIGDNKLDVPFITFTIDSQTNDKRDMDAMIFTLTDIEDPTNYVSVMLGMWNDGYGNRGMLYGKGTDQRYIGCHYLNGNKKKMSGLCDQSTMAAIKTFNTGYSSISLYYDNESKEFCTDTYWANYPSRGGTVTNNKGQNLAVIRNLQYDVPEGDKPYKKTIKNAYLKITTVRGWYLFQDEFGEKSMSTIYQSTFDGSADPKTHSLSDYGARYLLRSIDGTPLDFSSGSLKDTGKNIYSVSDVTGDKDVKLPHIISLNAFLGKKDEVELTKGLYVKVSNSSGNAVEVNGLNGGKWTENVTIKNGENGNYKVSYFKNADLTEEFVSYNLTIHQTKPEMDKLIFDNNKDTFEGKGFKTSYGNIQVGNSKDYNGMIVTAPQGDKISAIYQGEIDISNNTKDDVLIEFMPMPTKVGTFDYRSINFKFYNPANQDEYFIVRYYHEGSNPKVGGLQTRGNNQEFYGLKSIRNNNEYDFTGISQNIAGQAVGSIKYQSIKLYYDKFENCLYVDPTYGYTDQNLLGKVKVRDFDDDLKLGTYNSADKYSPIMVDQPAWKGFSTDKIKVEVFIDAVTEAQGQFGVINIDGTKFAKRLDGQILSDGIVGYNYPIPTPTYYNVAEENYQDFNKSFKDVKVFDENEKELIVENNSFKPLNAGKYTFVYGILENGKSYGAKFVVDVKAEENAEKIVYNLENSDIVDGLKLYIGDSVKGNVTATTNLYLGNDKNCKVNVSLYKDGELVKDYLENEDITFVAENLGDYKLVYKASDYVGRTVTKEVNFAVTRTSVQFKDENKKDIVFDRTNGVPQLKPQDIEVKDVFRENGELVVTNQDKLKALTTEIYISENNGEYKPLNDVTFANTGKYMVKYVVTYKMEGISEKITSNHFGSVTIVDNNAPVFENKEALSGAVLNDKKTENNATWYKAKNGSSITINKLTAKDKRSDNYITLSDVSVIVTNPKGQTTDVTSLIKDNKYQLNLSENGDYYILYKVSDGALQTVKTVVVEVKNLWLTADLKETLENGVFGSDYKIEMPSITDINRNKVSDAKISIEISSNGMENKKLSSSVWKADRCGKVKIIYNITSKGESIVLEREIDVVDDQKPVIKFNGEKPTTGYIGKTVVLPDVIVEDNVNGRLSYRVYLEHNGVKKELSDISFIPEEEGSYKVIVEAVDNSGLKATEEIIINVAGKEEEKETEEKKGCKSSLSSTLALIPLIGMGLVFIKKREEK